MRTTSIQAYNAVKDSGLINGRRWQVYETLFHKGPLTQNEAWQQIVASTHSEKLPKQSINPRFAELERLGVVAPVGRKICSVTGASCLAWDVTASMPVEPPRRVTPKQLIKKLEQQLRAQEIEINDLRIRLSRWGRPTKEEQAARCQMPTVQTNLAFA